jgi:hypothetical protein
VLGISEGFYDLLKTIHVLAAIVWVGGGIFMPASMTVLLMGILMVSLTDGLEFLDLWIVLGLAGIASTIAIGAGFLGPEAGRLGTLVAERGMADPEVRRRRDRIFLVSRIDLAVIVLVVVVMVFKPGA